MHIFIVTLVKFLSLEFPLCTRKFDHVNSHRDLCWHDVRYFVGQLVKVIFSFVTRESSCSRAAPPPPPPKLESLRSTTRRHDDALSKQRNLSYKTKALNNLWSQRFPPRLCHPQHNVKLSIITSLEQRA